MKKRNTGRRNERWTKTEEAFIALVLVGVILGISACSAWVVSGGK